MTVVQPLAPAELPAAGARPLTLGSLCTGYGGLDLAVAQVLDVAPAWFLTRGAQLKALGNGVVWQQGAAALAHLITRIELEVT